LIARKHLRRLLQTIPDPPTRIVEIPTTAKWRWDIAVPLPKAEIFFVLVWAEHSRLKSRIGD
jgi:hypothetical protein